MGKLTSALFLLAALFTVSVSWGTEPVEPTGGNPPPADGGGQPGRRPPRRHGPPPAEALAACKGKTAGTACTFQGPPGTETGVCENTPDGKYFGCKPAGHPGEGRPGEG